MGKTCKVVVCGQAGVGKTAILEQLVNGDHIIGSDSTRPELQKHYLSFADGYVMVYDVTNESSFLCMDKLKKFLEKNKEKKEAVIIALGNKCDLKDSKQVDFNTANKWAQTEKIRLWEVSVSNRQSLMDSFVWLTSKMTQPPSKKFTPFGDGKKKTDQLS